MFILTLAFIPTQIALADPIVVSRNKNKNHFKMTRTPTSVSNLLLL